MTHPGRGEGLPFGTVRLVLLAAAFAATTTSNDHAPLSSPPFCAVCGRASLYVRHNTLARRGRPARWTG